MEDYNIRYLFSIITYFYYDINQSDMVKEKMQSFYCIIFTQFFFYKNDQYQILNTMSGIVGLSDEQMIYYDFMVRRCLSSL